MELSCLKKDSSPLCIWFWQRIVTPHMAALVIELARQGCDVTYVAEEQMSEDRIKQGWTVPRLPGVRLEFATTVTNVKKLATYAPDDSIHLCQGIRANGHVRHAQAVFKARGIRQWVIMETVDDTRWQGLLKRFEYRRLFTIWRKSLEGVLAIGQVTPHWVIARGVSDSQVFPFAYFLRDITSNKDSMTRAHRPFRFIFVGQFIERKKLGLLLDALKQIDHLHFELAVVGVGPMERKLKCMAEKLLPGRVYWVGRLTQDQVPAEITRADCLVLPSRHDGWGAVVSESLMVGTPVICSNTCGTAGVVQASGQGGSFASENRKDLIDHLQQAISNGVIGIHDRYKLANWATCLGAKAGASYLVDIINYNNVQDKRPAPPWIVSS